MGGGDLNAKKSWHPNTLKNQERVWKAEQAALEEKKRITELQNERAQEREHAELTALVKNRNSNTVSTDDRLQWMYDKPDKKGQTEEYLLGKAIDASFDRPSQSEQGAIPALIRRPGPSDTSGTDADVQVDIARKLREDPLVLVKERERAARAALLNNPLQRRRLTELLRQEQEKNREKKEKSKSKAKSKNLDHMIATKLSALGGENNINLIELLDSDSSDDSSIKYKHKHKKKKAKKDFKDQKSHKKSKKVKLKKERHSSKHKRISDSDSSSAQIKHEKKSKVMKTIERVSPNHSKLNKQGNKYTKDKERPNKQVTEKSKSKHKHYSDSEDSKAETKVKKHSDGQQKPVQDKRRSSFDRSRQQEHKTYDTHYKSQASSSDSEAYKKKVDVSSKKTTKRRYDESSDRKRVQMENVTCSKSSRKVNSLSEAERAARLAEMVKAGVEHESERGKRVAAQRAAINSEDKKLTHGMQARSEAHALPTSLESRIKSNRHYIQRDKRHMNEHFARR
ncbi:Pre-mRNA-splicing factor CWC25 homolog [Eumeta japonica]|uniref:Pre-mRNA-splicing factor CWC25 homolog n=1 Tax=Eumeta variegata TaxID=151549 RepID=A0A4C1YQR8_EUMVA|nr:Pre-mRNA-splicing factor CWC25 homolog [Eumeta japonica]